MAYVSEELARPQRSGVAALFAIISLSLWQLRQTWRFIVLTGVGMIAAIVLVCAGPLYSQVALNTSLRDFITTDPTHSVISLQGRVSTISADSVKQATEQINQSVAKDIGPAVPLNPQFYVQSSIFSLVDGNPSTIPAGQPPESNGSNVLLNGFPAQDLPAHIHLTEGNLPQPSAANSRQVEMVITPEMAQTLQLHVGDILYSLPPSYGSPTIDSLWSLKIVGLFTPKAATDPFWQTNTFQAAQQSGVAAITALTTSEVLVNAYAQPNVTDLPSFFWTYHLDPTQVDASQSGKLVSGIHTFLADVSRNSMLTIDLSSSPHDDLSAYNDRMALAQVSVGLLLVLVVGMVLLFISLMGDLLVEQRVEAIALLRSRGASRRQVFGVFAAQCLGLGVISLLAGMALALPLTRYLLHYFLPASDQAALDTILGGFLDVLKRIWPYAVIAVAVILLTMLFALFRETRFDVLALRRESARSTRRPFWQRFYLDVLIALLALIGYGYVLYAIGAAQLNTQASVQVFAPLTLLCAALMLVAGVLLFLRLFPLLLRWATALASRRGSVASMLALAQMARAPQRALRTTLLFTLATAFAIFTLIFTATQNQRIVDIASFQVGSDFSAQIVQTTAKLPQQTNYYNHIPGVASASVGYVTDLVNGDGFNVTLKAVDPKTFEQAAIWTEQDSTQPLKTLLHQLSSLRLQATHTYVVPAYADATTWKTLHLRAGAVFIFSVYIDNPAYKSIPGLPGGNGQKANVKVDLYFKALDKVEHIPTTTDLNQNIDTSSLDAPTDIQTGSLLVDYQSFAAAYAFKAATLKQEDPANSFLPNSLPLNFVWVRTSAAANMGHIRSTLLKRVAPATPLYDRGALITTLEHDPFYLDLLGVLVLGTITPLLLALLSSLLTSWLTAYSRLTIFALLRALGSAPRQLAGLLSWEQGIIYTIMFSLGILAGAILSAVVLPTLIITDVALLGSSTKTASGVAILQDLPAIHIVLPPALWIVFGLLISISVLALTMMILMVSRPSISQTLRLNAD